MEIEAFDENYHLWISSSKDKESLKYAKEYAYEHVAPT